MFDVPDSLFSKYQSAAIYAARLGPEFSRELAKARLLIVRADSRSELARLVRDARAVESIAPPHYWSFRARLHRSRARFLPILARELRPALFVRSAPRASLSRASRESLR